MNSVSSLIKIKASAYKYYLFGIASVLFTSLGGMPAHAHHPFEGREPDTFSSLEGLIAGFAHPIIGSDHFLFLLSIGLISTLSFKRWFPSILVSGLLGTLISLVISTEVPGLEIVIGISLFAALLVSRGLIKPAMLLPLIFFHGYALGDAMVGADVIPLITYCLGLIISQGIIIYVGIIIFRRFFRLRPIFSGSLILAGLLFTSGTI